MLRLAALAVTAMSGCQCYQPVEECEPPADAGPNYHDTCTTAADCRTGNFWYCGGEIFRQPSCIDGRCLYDRFGRTCTSTASRFTCEDYSFGVAQGCNQRCTLEVGLSNCAQLPEGSRWLVRDGSSCRATITSLDGGDVLGTWTWFENADVIADFPRLGGLCNARPGYWACADCEAFVQVVECDF